MIIPTFEKTCLVCISHPLFSNFAISKAYGGSSRRRIYQQLNQKNQPPLYRNQVIQLGNVYFMEASANYVLLCTVYGMFGGLTCFFIGWSLYIIKFVPSINILQEVIQSNAKVKLTFPLGVLLDARMV